MTTVYKQIKKQIQSDEWFQQNFSNDGQRFVAWYLRNIHLRDGAETKDDVTDGANDKQIDAVVVNDVERKIYVIQGKFTDGETIDAQPVREILSAWQQLRDLENIQSIANQHLRRKLAELAKARDDDSYEVCFELITTASLTEAAKSDFAVFQKTLAELSENENWDATATLVDREELSKRYDYALDHNSVINHTIPLSEGQYCSTDIAGTRVVLAAVQLKECLNFPGIKDGSLFQKNVRQNLGNNDVNKGIRKTIADNPEDFFFSHNGITAICSEMNITDKLLKMKGLNVINGCQSLNTILGCSETVKRLDDAFIMCRFYEIPDRERAEKISKNTNSQSAVKPRDLRSNDKNVLQLKRVFEQRYPTGYFITKRGETAPGDKDKKFVIELPQIAKYMMSWHAQRPNTAYNETKLFGQYFELLFKREYTSENILALHAWMLEIDNFWTDGNPLGFDKTLLAMRAYAKNTHLYAVSKFFAIISKNQDQVPSPSKCWEIANSRAQTAAVVERAGRVLNQALTMAADESTSQKNQIFSPQNWIKAQESLKGVNNQISQFYNITLPELPDDKKQAIEALAIQQQQHFESCWIAD